MTHPNKYMESRAKAVRYFIDKYNLSKDEINAIHNNKSVYRLFKHNVSLRTADEIYKNFCNRFNEQVPVDGEDFDQWKKRIVDYIVKYQRYKNYTDAEMGQILGITENRYNCMRRIYKIKDTDLWGLLGKVMDHKRKYRTKFMSQLSYWRNV